MPVGHSGSSLENRPLMPVARLSEVVAYSPTDSRRNSNPDSVADLICISIRGLFLKETHRVSTLSPKPSLHFTESPSAGRTSVHSERWNCSLRRDASASSLGTRLTDSSSSRRRRTDHQVHLDITTAAVVPSTHRWEGNDAVSKDRGTAGYKRRSI